MQLQSDTLLQEGKYRIKKVLGQKDFRITYLAEQLSLGRKVIINEFFIDRICYKRKNHTQIIEADFSRLRRYVTEYEYRLRCIASLSLDNIAQIYDIFQENNTIYSVEEYVEGLTLEKYISKNGALSESNAKFYITKIAEILKTLHCKNITHCEINPSNIWLRKDDEIVITNFRPFISTNVEYDDGPYCPYGMNTGYSPPEIFFMSPNFAPSYDIFSLGVTYYELLTGINPFAGGADVDIMHKQIKMQLPYDESIPKSLFKVLLKATAKKQVDRYQTAQEFKDAVINVIEGGTVLEPWWKETTKITIVIICIVAVVLALILIIINS